jgi:aldose 1-epimerase
MAEEVITLIDDQRGSRAKILPKLGFNCFSFQPMVQEERMEVLWSAPNFPSGTERPSGSGIPVLFPFPGRVRGTSFQFQGQNYELPPGDAYGNAIHGFVINRPWRIVEQSAKKATGEFQASIDDPSILSHWPADFLIRLSYTLAGNRLISDVEIVNPDDKPLPFGLGTHPYFRVPLGGHGDGSRSITTVPAKSRWELIDMLPTGKRLPVGAKDSVRVGMEFGSSKFDDVFTDLEFKDEQFTASIVDPNSTTTLVMNWGEEFPHCVVYTPPHREAICIEPYTSVPDAFWLEKRDIPSGLRILAPRESFTAKSEIRLDQRLGLGALPE